MLRRSLCLVAFAAIVTPAWAADPVVNSAALRPMPAPTTDAFLLRTAAANLFDLESSQLALDKSRSSAVRAFADRIVTDHDKVDAAFDKAVEEAGVEAPADEMEPPQRLAVRDLKTKEATAFDEQYVLAQYTNHVETVEMYRTYAASGDNPRLQKFARDVLPLLRDQLAQVKKLRK
ncbi:MAG: DUF4142 domain-containing protein [Proteobacteria bacterium]|nr:DUF4142 domain-containing protein [Pseudomonadota bacterium]